MALTQRKLDLRTWYALNLPDLELVPETSGVYWLGVDNSIIYIGSSTNLLDRLLGHYHTNDQCLSKATQFAIEPCSNYVDRERELLNGYLKANGRLPDCNERIP
jgi:hypothetical protein